MASAICFRRGLQALRRAHVPHMALHTYRACWAGRAARSRVHLLRTTAHLLAATPLGLRLRGYRTPHYHRSIVRASASQPYTVPLLAHFGLCSPTLRCDSVRTTRFASRGSLSTVRRRRSNRLCLCVSRCIGRSARSASSSRVAWLRGSRPRCAVHPPHRSRPVPPAAATD